MEGDRLLWGPRRLESRQRTRAVVQKGLTAVARTVSVRVQHPFDLDSLEIHRPRNLDWQRASALLYGDWGTSKAYVIGLAFVAAGFSSLPIILAVCVLTALVGINYMVVCRAFPRGRRRVFGGEGAEPSTGRRWSPAAGGGSHCHCSAERLGCVELLGRSSGTMS